MRCQTQYDNCCRYKKYRCGASLAGFVEDMKASGFVAEALQRHGIESASVAPAAWRPGSAGPRFAQRSEAVLLIELDAEHLEQPARIALLADDLGNDFR